jgi:DNA-binding transcriptional LysR family regulator
MGQLEDMQTFVRVVDAGSISKAAEHLGVAKSAVSRRLAELEQRLGSTLINRTTRRSSLTDAGRLYYERALRIIDDVDDMNAMAASSETSLAGRLRLAVPLSFGLEHLSPALNEFSDQHPELILHIDFSDRRIDLVQEGFDLAFRIADLGDSNLKARRITPIRLQVCASPDYLARHGTPLTPAELQHHECLAYESSGSVFPWKLLDRAGREHVIDPPARIVANNGNFLCDMAVAGRGIMVSPTFIAWQALARQQLVPVLPEFRIRPLNAYAVYPQTRFLSQRARLLIDFLVAKFGDNPYWDQNL